MKIMNNPFSIVRQCEENSDILTDLIKDYVFVDFFNTFLNLPVFGQTPLFLLSDNKWLTCPEIPHCQQQMNRDGFLKWLEAHRVVFFKQTELYHHYTFCKEILSFSYYHSEEGLKWTRADQWLLRRCLGSVRGMQRFGAFLKSTLGEELVLFCVRVERLLHMDLKDESQRLSYQALLTVIRLVHLREGSSVLAVCHIPTDDMFGVLSGKHPVSARKQILGQMRTQALHRLQSYWLPQFLRCCKASVWRVAECHPIVQEYAAVASGSIPAHYPMLSHMHPCQLEHSASGIPSYCSKRTKRHLWTAPQGPEGLSERARDAPSFCQWLPLEGKEEQKGCSNMAHAPEKCLGSNSTQETQVGGLGVPHTCLNTPACHLPCTVSGPAPPPDLHCYEHMQPSLSADSLAGGPFRAFLRAEGLVAQLHHLALWQELDLFLCLVLRAHGEGSLHAQRQVVAKRIAEAYLSKNAERHVPLESVTSRHLLKLLPNGAVIPWIYVAQHEICKVLCTSYDTFLDEDDKNLHSHLFDQPAMESVKCVQMLPSSGDTAEQQVRRMKEALGLCQGFCGHGDTEALSEESWALMALEDVRRGGSVHLHYRKPDDPELPFDLLAVRYPKLAAEKLSANYLLYCQRKPLDESASKLSPSVVLKKAPLVAKKNNSFNHTPSMRPRSFGDVFRTPVNFDNFKRFLRSHYAHGALLFIQEAEKLRGVDRPKLQRTKIKAIVDKFFRRDDPMDYLQCNAGIITQVPQMRPVPCEVLFTIQDLVSKSLEATWFKQYQDSFPPCPTVASDSSMRGAILKNKLKNVWNVFRRLIKSVCNFLNAMKDTRTRSEFEQYLRQSYLHFSEPCVANPSTQQSSDSPGKDEGETSSMTRRVINNKVVLVDFLVNDLSFYLECERFRNLADAGIVMASAGMYGENDHAMLHQKADMIIKLFLKSEISPKLRINIAEAQRDSILQLILAGRVDRSLFYPAIMTILPILVWCWKKFCCQKVMKNLYGDKGPKKQEVASSPEYVDPMRIENDWLRKVKPVISITDEHTTLRFTIRRGLKLILPQIRLDLKGCSDSDSAPHKVPSRQKSVSSYSTPDSVDTQRRNSSQIPHPEGSTIPHPVGSASSLSLICEEGASLSSN